MNHTVVEGRFVDDRKERRIIFFEKIDSLTSDVQWTLDTSPWTSPEARHRVFSLSILHRGSLRPSHASNGKIVKLKNTWLSHRIC